MAIVSKGKFSKLYLNLNFRKCEPGESQVGLACVVCP